MRAVVVVLLIGHVFVVASDDGGRPESAARNPEDFVSQDPGEDSTLDWRLLTVFCLAHIIPFPFPEQNCSNGEQEASADWHLPAFRVSSADIVAMSGSLSSLVDTGST